MTKLWLASSDKREAIYSAAIARPLGGLSGIDMSEIHCRYCFNVLLSYLEGESIPEWSHSNDSYALFVSWKKGSRHELRGCLGTFTPKPLGEALSEYAIASATRDSRFAPIAKREVHQLHVGVSLLTDFEQVADPLDWTPGLHGIIVEFMVESRKYRATYLPEIALEQGWSRKETLTSLVKKAGFNGRPTDRLLGSLRVQRYKSTKFTLSYDDYIG